MDDVSKVREGGGCATTAPFVFTPPTLDPGVHEGIQGAGKDCESQEPQGGGCCPCIGVKGVGLGPTAHRGGGVGELYVPIIHLVREPVVDGRVGGDEVCGGAPRGHTHTRKESLSRGVWGVLLEDAVLKVRDGNAGIVIPCILEALPAHCPWL